MANRLTPPKEGDLGTGGGDATLVPTGDYLIALIWFQRKDNKSGHGQHLRQKWVVCDGPLAGSQFFLNMGLDLSVEGVRKRWQSQMDVHGIDYEVDLDDDQEIATAFKFKPILARVERKTENGYDNNNLSFFTFKSKYTEADWDRAREWRDANDKDAWKRLDEVSRGGTQGNGSGRSAVPADDDNIPF
jgi:hypothetical protein